MTRTEIWLTEMMCHFKSIDDMYRYYEHLVSLPNCNTCKRRNCKHKPKYGEDVRFNCFAYTDEEPKNEPTAQTETQNSNLTFEKRTMRDCYNCKKYEPEGECIECNYEPKDEPQKICKYCNGKCSWWVDGNCMNDDCRFKPKDEPQTERSE